MKINEITVGDWVHYSINLGEDNVWDEKMQIVDIYGNQVNCNIEYDIVISGYLISNLTPIPLTEEMLEVNGFKYDDKIEEFRLFKRIDEYNRWSIQAFIVNDGFVFDVVFEHLKCSNSVHRKITYVHELQHALRLCGLNELADNFSIK